MKRNFSLWLGLLAFALLPALAQTPASTKSSGKIHGHLTNPAGAPQSGGTVTLMIVGTASGPGLTARTSEKASFTVDANGDYAGEVAAGIYDAVYRSPGVPADKVTDESEKIKVTAGQDLALDFDMSRKDYIDKLSPDERKQLEEIRKKNSEAMKANETIKTINADLKTSVQNIHDAENAHATALQLPRPTSMPRKLRSRPRSIPRSKLSC